MADEQKPNDKKSIPFIAASAAVFYLVGMGIGILMGVYGVRKDSKLTPRTGDFDGDGRQDIALYVANEQRPKYIFLKQEDGTYRRVEDVSSERMRQIEAEVERVRRMQNAEITDWYMKINQNIAGPDEGGK